MSKLHIISLLTGMSLLLLGIALVGCGSKSNLVSIGETAENHRCTAWDEIAIGEWLLSNNIWNSGGITNFEQCVYQVQTSAAFPFGWTWSWPAVNANVKAYPEVIYGWKPWNSASTTTNLPIRVADINEMTVSYDISSQRTGSYNLAFDVWLNGAAIPSPENNLQELMIWLDRRELNPAGRLVERVTLGGEAYDFYIQEVISWGTWVYIAFVKVSQEYQGSTPIHEFINYLVQRNYVTTDEYVSSIEFGNELVSGTGDTTFNSYAVTIN